MPGSNTVKKGYNAVRYLDLLKRCPINQIHHLRDLETQHRNYVEKLNDVPEHPPEIDWEFYIKNVLPSNVGLVNDFKKKYAEFKVPRPVEKLTLEIDKQAQESKKEVENLKKKSNDLIEVYNKEIKRIQSLLPYDQMTLEEYAIHYPDLAHNFIKKPTFWPHLPDEQTPGPSSKVAPHE